MKKIMLVLMLLIAACAPQPEQPILPALPTPIESAPAPLEPPLQQQPVQPPIVETKDTAELSFDLSIEEANPLDFDPAGPFFHTLYRTTSTDGLSFIGKEKIFDHAKSPSRLTISTP